MKSITLATESATKKLGQKLAKLAVKGDVICLKGDLGAGKSTLARAFIKAMGTKSSHIPSPTYTIVQFYEDTKIPIAHLDCYRLESADEIQQLGLENFLQNGVIIAEWPLESFVTTNPKAGTLTLELVEFENGRKAQISATGTWENRLDNL